MREGEVVVVEMGREGVDELGEGCPETRVARVRERVEEGGGRGDAGMMEVEEEVREAGEDDYSEEGEGRNDGGHGELAVCDGGGKM